MSLNNSTYTQSLGIPFTQYVTSSAGHALISSSTYFNDTSDNLPRYKDADGNVLVPFVSSSYAVTASYALNGGGGSDTNFANTDLTFTADRTHDSNGFDFYVTADSGAFNSAYVGYSLTPSLGMGLPATTSSIIGIGNSYLQIYSSSITFSEIRIAGTSSITAGDSQLTINSQNKNYDFAVYGATDTSLLVTDASTDRVGIGKNTPNAKLDVNGDTLISGSLTVSGSVHKFDGNVVTNDTLQVTSAGNISTAGTYTPAGGNYANLRVDGTTAVTLADGTTGGILYIFCGSLVSPGTTTVTPTNASGFASLQFNALGDTATLLFISPNWYLLSSHNVTVS